MFVLSPKQTAVVAGLCLAVVPLALDGRRPRADATKAERDRLDDATRQFQERQRANRAIVADLVAGRTTLEAATELLLLVNAGDDSYLAGLRSQNPAPTLAESAAASLLVRVEVEPGPGPAERAEAVARVTDEFARLYGHPPERGPTRRDGGGARVAAARP